ncbi:hypothetical protein GQ53DRAFT_740258 [Thozetella sp. PMI_491]|nr:hypothetical protein GQ53DRAFT_740258 [Thozetella sp. PMI_491]
MPSTRHKARRNREFPENILTPLKFFAIQISLWGASRHRDRRGGDKYHDKEPRHLAGHRPRKWAVGVPPSVVNRAINPDADVVPNIVRASEDSLDDTRAHDVVELSDDDGSVHRGREASGQYLEEDSDEDEDEDSDSESEDDFDVESEAESDADTPVEELASDAFSETGIALPASPPELPERESRDSDAAAETSENELHTLPIRIRPEPYPKNPLRSIPPEIREGNIAKVTFEECGPHCQYYAKDYTVRKKHRWQKHRGEKHALVIVQASRDDDIRGYTCTSLSQRPKLTQNRLKNDYLRLEGGKNEFWDSIKKGPDGETRRVPSNEGPQLFIQGVDKMPEATYVEISQLKSFPIDRLDLFHGILRKLTPESLEFLRNATTLDGREMPTAGVPVRPAGNTHERKK